MPRGRRFVGSGWSARTGCGVREPAWAPSQTFAKLVKMHVGCNGRRCSKRDRSAHGEPAFDGRSPRRWTCRATRRMAKPIYRPARLQGNVPISSFATWRSAAIKDSGRRLSEHSLFVEPVTELIPPNIATTCELTSRSRHQHAVLLHRLERRRKASIRTRARILRRAGRRRTRCERTATRTRGPLSPDRDANSSGAHVSRAFRQTRDGRDDGTDRRRSSERWARARRIYVHYGESWRRARKGRDGDTAIGKSSRRVTTSSSILEASPEDDTVGRRWASTRKDRLRQELPRQPQCDPRKLRASCASGARAPETTFRRINEQFMLFRAALLASRLAPCCRR